MPNPNLPEPVPLAWQPPRSATCGWRGLSAAQIKEALKRNTEPKFPPKAVRQT